MSDLDKMIQNYNIDNFNNEIKEAMEETKDDAEHESQNKKR